MEWFEQFFRLSEDEKIIEDIKPLPALKWYFLLTNFIAVILLVVVLIILFLPTLLAVIFVGPYAILGFFVALSILLFVFFLAYLFAHLRYTKQHYWITNKRVIFKRGLIGYAITSVPYERISDVIVSRSFLERLLGFGSVFLQTMTGQISPQQRFGAETALLAVPDPEGLQQRIFELMKRKRKEEGLTI
jgi:uncharacterized membrane protein YdbT with pleckstrin-like domain